MRSYLGIHIKVGSMWFYLLEHVVGQLTPCGLSCVYYEWKLEYSFWKLKGTQMFETLCREYRGKNKRKGAWNNICKSKTEGYENKLARK
jgi:hypothetical protein